MCSLSFPPKSLLGVTGFEVSLGVYGDSKGKDFCVRSWWKRASRSIMKSPQNTLVKHSVKKDPGSGDVL